MEKNRRNLLKKLEGLKKKTAEVEQRVDKNEEESLNSMKEVFLK